MLTRILDKNLVDMEVTVKENIRQKYVALLSYWYQNFQRVFDQLQTKTRVEINSAQDFFDEQLKYFDFAYLTDKHSAYLCEKDETKDVQDEDVKVFACALLNGYADQTKEDIEVNYIATKFIMRGQDMRPTSYYRSWIQQKKRCK